MDIRICEQNCLTTNFFTTSWSWKELLQEKKTRSTNEKVNLIIFAHCSNMDRTRNKVADLGDEEWLTQNNRWVLCSILILSDNFIARRSEKGQRPERKNLRFRRKKWHQRRYHHKRTLKKKWHQRNKKTNANITSNPFFLFISRTGTIFSSLLLSSNFQRTKKNTPKRNKKRKFNQYVKLVFSASLTN